MMKHRKCRRIAIISAMLILLSSFPVHAEEEVKHSTVDYELSFREAGGIFIGNEAPVDWEVGDKYFLHYTVTEVGDDQTNQWGMLTTKNPTDSYPYETGAMRYSDELSICEKGWTYLFRFEVTEDGFDVLAGKANEDGSSYIQFPYVIGDVTAKTPYFGVWITGTNGESLTAELRNIRCYDASGKDLGVSAPKASEIKISEMNALDVNHSYSFSVEDVGCMAFGNARYTKSDVIMLEYTVSNVKAEGVTQSGAEFTNAPKAYYPHQEDMGYLNFDINTKAKPTKLISEGANYLVRFERQKDGFYVMVKRTQANGAVDYFSFTEFAGKYRKDYGYAVMWIGEECGLTADFTNVKCYDAKGNNLAVQTNKDVEISHYGDLEDYKECVADYYCKKNKKIITLDQESAISIKTIDKSDETKGTYSIGNGVLKLAMGEEKKEWTYAYEYIKDTDGNKYMRLRENKVTFKSHTVNGEVLSTSVVSAETGWKIDKPQEPLGENGKFLGWVDGSGKKYDFDTIVTESMTLYATWDGEQEWPVLQSFIGGLDTAVVVTTIACVLLIGGTTAGTILFVRKRGKSWK